MVMDSAYSDVIEDFIVDGDNLLTCSDRYTDVTNGFRYEVPSPDLGFMNIPSPSPDPGSDILSPSLTVSSDFGSSASASSWSPEGDDSSPIDIGDHSSDPILKYISQILMEENMDEKPCMLHDPSALEDTEKSLYHVLGEKYPPSNSSSYDHVSSNVVSQDSYPCQKTESLGSYVLSSNELIENSNCTNSTCSSAYLGADNFADLQRKNDVGEYKPFLQKQSVPRDFNFHSNFRPRSSLQRPDGLTNSLPNIDGGLIIPSVSELMIQSMFSDKESILQFQKGLEEASKFLPSSDLLNINLEANALAKGQKVEVPMEVIKKESGSEHSPDGLRSRKNHVREETYLEEGRSNKQFAIYAEEEADLSDMFDKVLLCQGKGNNEPCALNGAIHHHESHTPQPIGLSNGSTGGKTRAKKHDKKKETVDLSTLLVLCAQAVSCDDHKTARELLKQIRLHSSPLGDGFQRLAHCFANALEARMTGSGSTIQSFYTHLTSNKTIAADMLKAYQVYLQACPFKKLPIFFANKMIVKVAENASALHVIDFGIAYGFQWPFLIQLLSTRPGGPPKLRITGIELPRQGFRPTQMIDETGLRLKKYCERYNVPFEFNPIAAQNWESVQIEDLKIDSNEVLAVNCMFRFKHLADETVEVNSPRSAVLNLIRRLNPSIFVHSVVNGSYNSPFFVTRFREALFYFSALFDMFEATLPREDPERLMLEREFYGRESINVIACEGAERVERPESYKQWHGRHIRAGFKQLPLDHDLMKRFRAKLKAWYHKDFVMDLDNQWFLQGWKGRIVYASSCWVPS